MRICHIIWGLGTGGAETMLVDIVNEQINKESVMLIVINDIVSYDLATNIDSRVKLKFLGRKLGSKSVIPWLKMNIALWSYNPDVIHCHIEGFARMIMHPAVTVCTIHNTETTPKEYPLFKQRYSISEGVKKHTKQQGYDSIVVYNGIHTDTISIKQDLCRHDTCNIVCVGRLSLPYKGQDVLIKAADILVSKLNQNLFHIDLIGDGPSLEELRKLTDKYNLQRYVSFLGQKDRKYIYSHLCDYDLYVMPSRTEGFGLTVAEAVCARVPVLVPDLDGPMEIIANGAFGRTFRCGDYVDLAQQISTFMTEGASKDIIEKAYRFAIANFNIKSTANNYLKEYSKLIN